jgi:hypothetical protein
MNFFGRDIEVTKVEDQFYVKMEGILNSELVRQRAVSLGIPLDDILPLMGTLQTTGWDGLFKRELISHIVLDRTFQVGDMNIPMIVDVDFGRRFRLSTYREGGRIWVCAIQLEQAAHGIFYDLRVAKSLVPSLKDYIPAPFRPRVVWQNDEEMMVYFIPLEHADAYMKLMESDITKMYTDKYCGTIKSTVEAVWEEQTRLRLV